MPLLPKAHIDSAAARTPHELRRAMEEFVVRNASRLIRRRPLSETMAFIPDFFGIGITVTADENGNPVLNGVEFK